MTIEFWLNGLETQLICDADDYLLDVLRRHGILSVRRSCDSGLCGGCTVLLDSRPVLACTLLAAKVQGRQVLTAEGLQAELTELAEHLTAEGAEQCGYCSPGLAITILAMKKELVHPDEQAILHYLTGNLCRCSGYVGQLRAIKRYMGVN